MLFDDTSNEYMNKYISSIMNKGIHTFLSEPLCKDNGKDNGIKVDFSSSFNPVPVPVPNSDNISNEMKHIMTILGMDVSSEKDLFGVLIDRDMLLRVDIEQKLSSMIEKLKIKYKSSKLNCLHKTRDHKQKFPGINLIRQIFKCNGYHLKPVVYSRGYCKHNGKKLTERNFKIVRCDLHEDSFK